MIGMTVEGFRVGQEVRVTAPQHVYYNFKGRIVQIIYREGGSLFYVQVVSGAAAVGLLGKHLRAVRNRKRN